MGGGWGAGALLRAGLVARALGGGAAARGQRMCTCVRHQREGNRRQWRSGSCFSAMRGQQRRCAGGGVVRLGGGRSSRERASCASTAPPHPVWPVALLVLPLYSPLPPPFNLALPASGTPRRAPWRLLARCWCHWWKQCRSVGCQGCACACVYVCVRACVRVERLGRAASSSPCSAPASLLPTNTCEKRP